MRISSSLFFQTGLNSINKQQSDLMRVFQQMSTQKRMITPSDDPLASAQTINLAQAQAMDKRYGENREVAMRSLGEEENILNAVNLQLQGVQTRLVEAATGTLSDADRSTLATVMESSLETLLGFANTKDGSGQYLFSGSQGTTQAFERTGNTYSYKGDGNSRDVQVEQTRQLDVADHGRTVFERANPGSASYFTQANSNAGTAVVSSPNGNSTLPGAEANYTIRFTSETEYDIEVNGAVVSQGVLDENERQRISLPGGVSVQIEGKPEVGDSFTVSSVDGASSDEMSLFNTLQSVVDALRKPVSGDPAAQAEFRNVMNSAMQRIGENFDNVQTVISSVGTRMNEIDALSANGAARALSYTNELSRLEDLNPFDASTQLQLRKAALEMSALAFQTIQSMSLFNMNR
ncbi:flagellar hook-associated protein 3 [Alcaligenes pakistanensis]|uniref:Flagellar hook-associated protein 3 n=1 Tax=Alcaligenes pakistanensis TaxID=1482717 RepID=A0A8H9M1F3_9BURK|nr:flagellar hook-associated protein FlgL [Alcaligenes pakistanensis]GHC55113.1 flagellar hook-associated protein 3 [Alcaligenes pakistanensis]